MKQILLKIEDGVVKPIIKPRDIQVIVRDYQVWETDFRNTKEDEHGNLFYEYEVN